MSVHDKAARAGSAFPINYRIAATKLKAMRARPDALHLLLDRFGHRTHARAARRHRRHATQRLQALRKVARVTINVTIETCKGHTRNTNSDDEAQMGEPEFE